MNRRLPVWLTKRVPSPDTVDEVERMMRSARLHTVCESARCPNIGECWSSRTATFLILGDTCTRNCGFCAVAGGRPQPLDPGEAERVAETARKMNLRHVVVTSVTRDDLPDQGAGQFAAVIRALRRTVPESGIEVLTPDFQGDRGLIEVVVAERPDIFNHNIETVRRLSPAVRPQAKYERSLEVLRIARELGPSVATKSGVMLGLGETRDEVIESLRDLRGVGVAAVTIGQYLRPTLSHLPVVEYVEPQVFDDLACTCTEMGFAFVASSPFTRSSYRAARFAESVGARTNGDQARDARPGGSEVE